MNKLKERITKRKETMQTRKSILSRLRRVLMTDDMAQKLTFYFFLVILIFALIISAAFTGFFGKELVESSREELEARTVAFANSLSRYLSTPDGRGVINFSTYLKVLSDTNISEPYYSDTRL